MKNELVLSTLGHTWLLDLDGTIVKHNGYKLDGKDSALEGALDFLHSIPEKDFIIFITSREEKFKNITENFLRENHIRYDKIIFGLPYGERILINDKKPSGLEMSVAVNTTRDADFDLRFCENALL